MLFLLFFKESLCDVWDKYYPGSTPTKCMHPESTTCYGNIYIDYATFQDFKDTVINIPKNVKFLIARSKFMHISRIDEKSRAESNTKAVCILLVGGQSVIYRVCAFDIETQVYPGKEMGGCCSLSNIETQNKIIESSFQEIKTYSGTLFCRSESGSIEIKSINISNIHIEMNAHYVLEASEQSNISFSYFGSSISDCRSTFHSECQYHIMYCQYVNNTDTTTTYQGFTRGTIYFEKLPVNSESTVENCLIIKNSNPYTGIDPNSNAKIVFKNCHIETDVHNNINTGTFQITGTAYSAFRISNLYLYGCLNPTTAPPNPVYHRDRKWKLAWNLK